MSPVTRFHCKFFRSTAKICALLSIALLFFCNNAFSKTMTIACPTVKTTLTPGYKITSSDGYQWSSWQKQPRVEVSTINDKNYLAEINQSAKGIELRCVGGSEQNRYGFYTHIPKITSCKIDKNKNTAFICED